jgi:hypothetical protein
VKANWRAAPDAVDPRRVAPPARAVDSAWTAGRVKESWMKLLLVAVMAWWLAAPAGAQCCGDCGGDGTVAINDLITAVNNALNGCSAQPCCGDCGGDGEVTINDLIVAVNNALNGCTATTPTVSTPATPTRTPTRTRKPTNTRKPTPTITPVPRCAARFNNQVNNTCLFNGTFNRGCGDALNSTFASNGTFIVVTVATNLVIQPTVSFRATVTSATTATLTTWSTDNFQTAMTLTGSVTLNNNGEQLVIFPDSPPFNILGCPFVQYLGANQRTRSAAADSDGRLP